ncbi:hypothetical protein HETIRDRAFT_476500 [Heterobasidion irregulare TC 32-1]|uniref:DUF7904 domain-containing protein n=1 Tax=Heterobasidion irregulare (strain TC 32-1) TaxID=747525 RepID=W4K4S9_HETIT|nr:uncharacterized protein HETIRDRAFT_476500 [Heterobasidion irregulare TC 32-1]ETW80802.1 hypothetical protein HETIRDRAFT_476500 [Heterobasidion irregulare TC 32-1]
MEFPASPSARSYTLPKPPESGLAEWTQKIKALQRQVDADEEEEQKKLEQEIAASRLARVRRSTRVVPARDDDDPSLSSLHAEPPDDARSSIHADALQKLTGASSEPTAERSSPARSTLAIGMPDFSLKPTATAPPSRSEPVSLAAFIGGRATAPRLNRHAPQADAHDPTQFEQRTTIAAPHPVFGRGGVAMPGLAAKGRVPAAPISPSASTPERAPLPKSQTTTTPTGYGSDREGARERRMSNSPALRRYVQHVEQQGVPPQKTGSSSSTPHDGPRLRTVSTPSGPPPMRATTSSPKSRPLAIPPAPYAKPAKDLSKSPSIASSPPPVRSPTFNSYPPAPRPSVSATPSPKTPSISAPSLARPIQPTPKTPASAAHGVSPSPAFLKPSMQKDPTPSISRLKGRGFVQSMVLASSQLELGPSTGAVSETGRLVAGKRLSVADRWKPDGATSSPSSPPAPAASKPVPLRKARAADPPPTQQTPSPPKPIEPHHTGRSLRTVPSNAALSTTATAAADASSPPSRDALGSSSTLISYIKPMKTGDDPATGTSHSRPHTPAPAPSRPQSRSTTPAPGARSRTEGGAVRGSQVGGAWGAARGPSELPAPTAKPLSHLTKDRAKQPRRARPQPTAAVRVSSKVQPSVQKVKVTSANTPLASAPVSTTPPGSSRPSDSKVSSLADKWSEQVLIGVKPLGKGPPPAAGLQPATPAGLIGAHALPGLATVDSAAAPRERRRHSRIPSTGNRALVMDVAQALNEHAGSPVEPSSPSPPIVKDDTPVVPSVEVSESPKSILVSPPLERRKSSFERYSAYVMPPLKEEKTPAPSPANTLMRGPPAVVHQETVKQDVSALDESGSKPQQGSTTETAPISPHGPVTDTLKVKRNIIEIHHDDGPLPSIDVQQLLTYRLPVYTADASIHSISVDVMSITGTTATVLKDDTHIFYESEVLAVVHRYKTKSSGLVGTTVWGWRGKRSQLGEREDRKLKDLARHYGTSVVFVPQHCEPLELVHVLGGQLAIRQGSRSHWTAENTTMHLIRSHRDVIFIDEHDLSVSNLCSGFSFCLTLLGTLYVWHGCGSLPSERQAALAYARALSTGQSSVVELIEGESDNDEMFWMMLGERDYANADYWKWRPSTTADCVPRIWRVDGADATVAVNLVLNLPSESVFKASIYIIDCVWEFFVLVGKDARSSRRNIRAALSCAMDMSRLTASTRPFAPTVHVLVLPSQLPSDLRLHFRDIDEDTINEHETPDHMNLITFHEAMEHLGKVAWEISALKDHSMLPLGLHSSHFVSS